MRISLSEHYASMDGSHPDDTPVPNRHIITLDWWRTVLDISLTVADDIELNLFIPYDIKDQEVRFETLDGQPLNNPQGEIHHRTERLEGLGDLEMTGRFLLWGELRLTAGFSIPTGKTEDDPYELGDLGLRHRHIQFGTGTIDPILRLRYSLPVDFLSIDMSAGVRAPLYENRKGYKASTVIDFSIGPRVPIGDWLELSVRYTTQYQTRATWDGVSDENSGYFLQGVGVSWSFRLGERVVLRPNALFVYDVNVRSGADNFEMDWLIGISLDVSIPRSGGEEPADASEGGD